jgi:general stress protein YciG
MNISNAAKELGRKGGQKTASVHGKNHFSEMGKKSAAKRWANHKKKEVPQQ